jgi:cytochrome c553
MNLRIAVSALLLASPWALAQGPVADATTQQKALERGGKLVQVCANCHGANGNSRAPDIPNLAGQNAAYLHEQMRRFVDGRRKDVFMQGMIKAMSAAERNDVVSFLSAQSVQPQAAAAAPAAQLALGKRYYEKVCFRCHGQQALGDANVPRLAGQQTGYVVKSLRRYRDGTGERLEPVMAANTKLMSDDDIAAVAAYVSSMR